ncbi:apolipoprotein N-acyltransferase [Candidatus Poribacteria bacterium]|nr:apolipoprotein N-acyltransferase [Candidatus Poribacteria bacterium]
MEDTPTENFLKRHQPWMLAALSAILLFLSFPNANLFPFAWVALVPFFIAFRDTANGKSAFWIGYLTGFLFFGGLLTAIALLYPYANIFATMVGYLLLVGYTALYFAVFPVLMRIVPWRSGLLFPVAAAAIWTALEWVRSWLMTGFPWGSIGYSQWNNPLGIQIASLVGVHGISFVIVFFNAGIATMLCNRHRWRQEIPALVLPLILTLLCFGYGAFQLRDASSIDRDSDITASETSQTLNIALIPGNISQLEKWDIRQFPQILQRYINLTHIAGQENPDLIVWPETAIRSEALTGEWPTYYRRFLLMLRDIATPILIGTASEGDETHETIGKFYRRATEKEKDANIYNRVLSIAPDGKITGGYAKMHLVPFGEYVPLTDLLPDFIPNFIQFKPFAHGKSVNLLPVFNVKNNTGDEKIEIGASICFESVFPDEFRRPVQKGAQVMGIFTNDAWFKGTAFPELHLSMTPFRAVENRITVFRCANGGFTCVVDRFGRITTPSITPGTTQQVVMASVPLLSSSAHKYTLYTHYGDWFPMLCAIICIGWFGSQIVLRFRRRDA